VSPGIMEVKCEWNEIITKFYDTSASLSFLLDMNAHVIELHLIINKTSLSLLNLFYEFLFGGE
jgi:hypothetical protein